MKPLLFVFTLIAAISLLASPAAAESRPNILLVMVDDMGYSDLGCYGSKDIPTPQIDQLAAQGTRFTSAYVTAPNCVPSRMGLMSRKFPARFGVFNNVYGLQQNQLWIQQTTLADVLKKQGYLTDFFGTEACDFIQRVHRKNQEPGTKNNVPFFLYLAFNAPHAPLDGRDEDQAAIGAKDISADRRIYAAMVHAVDRNVGRVMAKLRELGLAENTLTISLNDNGGGNNAAVHTRNTPVNRPYRGHKFDLWEGGVRVPFIAHWPGRTPAGKVFDGIISSMDVFPTFAKVASALAESETSDAAKSAGQTKASR